ncbi:hypothetical protein B296_00028684 [Ensete ventricosum]|uniref:Uncharacterized protein n=1 Tax=Ensete ventricosum TaxID=4639 RepID=A0A427AC68_ENSVE|nr:hypothetical protein B296_00028684 [Ensete ventricosum]
MAIAAAKRYWLPLFLFALGFFFQLVVLPRSFPPFSELDPPVTTELVKVYSLGSPRCAQFIGAWKMIGTRFTSTHLGSLLEGVAQTGMVELDDVQLASYLAETKFTKQPYFRKGMDYYFYYWPFKKIITSMRIAKFIVTGGRHKVLAVLDS